MSHDFSRGRAHITDAMVKYGRRQLNLSGKTKDELNHGLNVAVNDDALTIAECYLKAGADPYTIDSSNSDGHGLEYLRQTDLPGYFPMDKALYNGNDQLVSLLLNYGVDPNSKFVYSYKREYSPFQVAIKTGREKCVKAMLKNGAYVSASDLKLASSNYPNIIQLLQTARREQAQEEQEAFKSRQEFEKKNALPIKNLRQKIEEFLNGFEEGLQDPQLTRNHIIDLFQEIKNPLGEYSFLHQRENPHWDSFRVLFKSRINAGDGRNFWHTKPFQRVVQMLKTAYLERKHDHSDLLRQKEANELIDYVSSNALLHHAETSTRQKMISF